ncbi:MAG TPA: alpha-L-arabinofuranosidase C-terminal domain-containing protein [Bryobacteraceae bacterium]|nr:alpha-L-arabinofuranosidase C-terminal domain-containing protein [Bryobacteraceae bacterium]
MMTRRTLLTALPVAGLLRGQQEHAATDITRVRIDAGEVIARVNPMIFGQFIEHLGRCIYGGIYEEGSPLSDERGFRKDVLAAVKRLHPPVLRWPGGNFVSSYHWEDGVGPKDQRPRRFDTAWFAIEPNRFGTNDCIEYCRAIGAEPYFCINLGTGTIEEAAHWVEYCNGASDTHYANLRRKHGYAEPHNVKYWGLGNEIYGTWQAGHKSAEDYAKVALEAAKMMKWVDPSIHLIACGAGDPQWNVTVLETLGAIVDYLSVHFYTGSDDYYETLASVGRAEHLLRLADSAIEIASERIRGHEPRSVEFPLRQKRVEIAFDEWNVWYRRRDGRHREVKAKLEEPYNLRDALWTASMLHLFERWGDKVTMATLAQMVNVIAPIHTSEKGLYLEPNFFPLELYRAHTGDRVVHAWSDGPGYDSPGTGRMPYLDICPTVAEGRMAIGVVNRHKDHALAAQFEILGAKPARTGKVFTINGPSPESANSFDQPNVVGTAGRDHGDFAAQFTFEFPAHSVTLLEIAL